MAGNWSPSGSHKSLGSEESTSGAEWNKGYSPYAMISAFKDRHPLHYGHPPMAEDSHLFLIATLHSPVSRVLTGSFQAARNPSIESSCSVLLEAGVTMWRNSGSLDVVMFACNLSYEEVETTGWQVPGCPLGETPSPLPALAPPQQRQPKAPANA